MANDIDPQLGAMIEAASSMEEHLTAAAEAHQRFATEWAVARAALPRGIRDTIMGFNCVRLDELNELINRVRGSDSRPLPRIELGAITRRRLKRIRDYVAAQAMPTPPAAA